jgi:hypothetical protein
MVAEGVQRTAQRTTGGASIDTSTHAQYPCRLSEVSQCIDLRLFLPADFPQNLRYETYL